MRKRFLLISLFGLLLTLSAGFSSTTDTLTSDDSWTNAVRSDYKYWGMTIEPNIDITLQNLYLATGCTANGVSIMRKSDNLIIGNATSVTNQQAVFSDLELDDGVQYYILPFNSAGSWDAKYKDDGASYPISGTNIDWISRVVSDAPGVYDEYTSSLVNGIINITTTGESNLNATLITDNSTNHLTGLNSNISMNFTTYNSTGHIVDQTLTLNISSIDVFQNFTSGDIQTVTFNNTNIWNYTVNVFNPFNTSLSDIFYFYSVNSNITFTFDNATNGVDSSIIFERNDYDNTPSQNFTYGSEYFSWNDTYQTVTGSNPYTSTVDIPIIDSLNTNVPISANITVTMNGESVNITDSETQWIFKYDIDDCSSYSTTVLNFTGRDEQTQNPINYSLEANFQFNNEYVYNFSGSGETYYTFCKYPATEDFNINAELSYVGTYEGYTEKREHFLINAPVTTTVETVNLYDLWDNQSEILGFTVEDDVGVAQTNTYVRFKRWREAENAYSEITTTFTNVEGQGNVYVEFDDVWYQVVIIDSDGNILKTFTRQKFTSSGVTFPITEEEGVTYITRKGCVTASVDWVNTTRLVATATDTCGTNTGINVLVKQKRVLSDTIICDRTITDNSVTTYCDTGNRTGNVYYVNVKADFDNEWVTFYSETLDYTTSTDYEGSGVFATFLIVGSMATLGGLIHPAISGVLAVFGLSMSYLLGFINIGWGIIFSIIMIVIIGIMVMNR